MAKIVTGCKHCGHLFKIEEIFEGIDVECPKCGEKVIVSTVAERDEKGLLTFSEDMDPILKQLYEKAEEMERAAAEAEDEEEAEADEGWESVAVAEEPGEPGEPGKAPSRRLRPPTRKKAPLRRKAPPPKSRKKLFAVAGVVLVVIVAVMIWYLGVKVPGDKRRAEAHKLCVKAEDEYNDGKYDTALETLEEFFKEYSDVALPKDVASANKTKKFATIEKGASELKRDAEQLYTDGKLDEAIAKLKKILTDYKESKIIAEVKQLHDAWTAQRLAMGHKADIKRAEELISQNKYLEARKILESIAKSNSPQATQARTLLTQLDEYDRKAQELYDKGREALTSKEFDEAIRLFKKVADEYPASPSAAHVEEAIAQAEVAKKQHIDETYDRLVAEARNLMKQKRYAEAVAKYEEALELKPDTPPASVEILVAVRKANLFENTIEIAGGNFVMGSDSSDPDENPAHVVMLDTFYISKCPVTNEEYKKFLDANPAYPAPYVKDKWAEPYNWDQNARTYPADKAKHPVVLVSYRDAVAYCNWKERRLPTEAEWERAARGRNGSVYPWGNRWVTTSCNYGSKKHGTTDVEMFPEGASEAGVMEMAGNVWEWCKDSYKEDFYKDPQHVDAPNNPLCISNTGLKVIRGGSWVNSSDILRCSNRYFSKPNRKAVVIGFRTALDATE